MKARITSILGVKKPKVRLIALTGTPISESPDNAYSLVRAIAPELAVSKSKWNTAFVESETVFFGGRGITKVKGFKNLDRLRNIMAGISIRRTMAEVDGMPTKVWLRRDVTLSAAQREAYNSFATKARAEAMTTALGLDSLGSVTLRLRQILNDPAILKFDKVPSAKFDALEEIADEVLEDPMAKMIVWTSFIDPIPRLVKRFAQYKPLAIYGEVNSAEVARMGQNFDRSANRIVIATPQKGGTGLDWLARARHAVYIDLPWSSTLFNQSQDRIVRRTNMKSQDPIEQIKGSPATLIELYVPGSADALVRAILDRKLDLINETSVSADNVTITREELLSFIGEIAA